MNTNPIGHREKIAVAPDIATLDTLLAEFEKFKYASNRTKRAVIRAYNRRKAQLTHDQTTK